MTVQYVGTYSTLCIGEWEYTHLCACIYEHKRQKERVWDKGKKRGLKEALCFTSLYFTTKHKRKMSTIVPQCSHQLKTYL